MAGYTDQFKSLAKAYMATPIDFPNLREVTMAQWTLESGYGQSRLAMDHLNFGGLKWRKEMDGFAEPVDYAAHDGADKYCKFGSIEKFIKGYWRFLDRDPYKGWRNHASDAQDFMNFIGPDLHTHAPVCTDCPLSASHRRHVVGGAW